MEIIERISEICKQNGTTVTNLEKELGYSNGSLAKAKDIPSSRILDISKRFNVPMSYIMTGAEQKDEFTEYQEQAELLKTIRHDKKMLNALEKFYKLSERQKEHVFELIDLLGVVSE